MQEVLGCDLRSFRCTLGPEGSASSREGPPLQAAVGFFGDREEHQGQEDSAKQAGGGAELEPGQEGPTGEAEYSVSARQPPMTAHLRCVPGALGGGLAEAAA